jgi:hypothetical protein
MHSKVNRAALLGLLALQLMAAHPAKAQPTPLGVRTGLAGSTPAPPAEAKSQDLAYKPAGAPLRIAELAQLQRKKLEEDYFKRAGFTTAPPLAVRVPLSKPATRPARAKTTHTLGLVAIFGPAKGQQAELRLNGITSTVGADAQIGPARVDAITPGQVRLTLRPPGRTALATQTLRPGEQLEWLE